MRTYIKFLVFVATPVLILCANAWGAETGDLKQCYQKESDAKKDPSMEKFVLQLGGGDYSAGLTRLQGHWGIPSQDVHLRITASGELQGKVNGSNWSTLKICTLNSNADELQIYIRDRTGKESIVRARVAGKKLAFKKLQPLPLPPFRGFITFNRIGNVEDMSLATAQKAPVTVTGAVN
ncbi:MAG TPA: hypothetical protein VM432_09225 [Bdellovibrionales bacterium]|nr:hypothetical protein [Bdellovibrionales bacterium]